MTITEDELAEFLFYCEISTAPWQRVLLFQLLSTEGKVDLSAVKPDPLNVKRCEQHGDVIEIGGMPRVCISCDGGVF